MWVNIRREGGERKIKRESYKEERDIYVDIERVLTGHMGLITLIGQCIKIIQALE